MFVTVPAWPNWIAEFASPLRFRIVPALTTTPSPDVMISVRLFVPLPVTVEAAPTLMV